MVNPKKYLLGALILLAGVLFFAAVLFFAIFPRSANAQAAPACFLLKWGSLGTGDGQFNTPHGIAVDSSNNIYVADTNNARIQKFACP